MNYAYRFLTLLIATSIVLFVLQPTKVAAHAGGGSPFLTVNGVFAQTNPLYLPTAQMVIPQDIIPGVFLVNEPIQFVVHTDKLLVPKEIADKTTFRWTFSENSKDFQFGRTVTQRYAEPKSYLVSLEAQAPGQTGFVLIDTVRIHVVSDKTYTLPSVTLSVETDKRQSNKPIVFHAKPKTDLSSTKTAITWDFGDGGSGARSTETHTYTDTNKYFSYYVIVRVTDSNGYVTENGLVTQSVKGKLFFIDKQGKTDTIRVTERYTDTTFFGNSSVKTLLLVGASLIIVVVIGIIMYRRKKH